MKHVQAGQIGELAAKFWFVENDWHMVRTQPAIRILGSQPGARYGRIFTVCMVGLGGVPDFTGYSPSAYYRACEVKEVTGNSCPASRLDPAQREFMSRLPTGCAWVGVWFVDHQKFEMFRFIERGAYKWSEANGSSSG